MAWGDRRFCIGLETGSVVYQENPMYRFEVFTQLGPIITRRICLPDGGLFGLDDEGSSLDLSRRV
jgi:hypothetical protein